MAVERVFMDWDRPLLPSVAEFLAHQHGRAYQLDLSQVAVVVREARAGRRLLELLLDQATFDGVDFQPPTLIILDEIPDRLIAYPGPVANATLRALAWAMALRELDEETLDKVVAQRPRMDQWVDWAELGSLWDHTLQALTRSAKPFEALVDAAEQMANSREGERWRLTLAAYRRYQQWLEEFGFLDPWATQLGAIGLGPEAPRRFPPLAFSYQSLYLVGLAEIYPLQRRLLESYPAPITVVIHAPGEWADAFDEWGRPSAVWANQPLPMGRDQVRVAHGPGAQATEVLVELSRLDGHFATEQITIGVPDAEVIPHLEQQLAGAGLDARLAEGPWARRSRPYRLLAAVADFLETPNFSTMAALVRHPDVEEWLGRDAARRRAQREVAQVEAAVLDLMAHFSVGAPISAPANVDSSGAEPDTEVFTHLQHPDRDEAEVADAKIEEANLESSIEMIVNSELAPGGPTVAPADEIPLLVDVLPIPSEDELRDLLAPSAEDQEHLLAVAEDEVDSDIPPPDNREDQTLARATTGKPDDPVSMETISGSERSAPARPRGDDWITEMDRFQFHHLRAELAGSGRVWALQRLQWTLERVLRGFYAGQAPPPQRRLAVWAKAVVQLLAQVYGSMPLDPTQPLDVQVVASCDRIHEQLRALVSLPLRSAPILGAAAALRMLLRFLEEERLEVAATNQPVLELLTWPELPLDDAPVLFLTGFNEGRVPAPPQPLPLISLSLRARLELTDPLLEQARAVYQLTAMLNARNRVVLIAGQRDAQSDPLLPSRMLFACDSEEVPHRVRYFFTTPRPTSATPVGLGGIPPAAVSQFVVPPPLPLVKPITALRVTAFRDYLACPYRFYLRQFLRLSSLHDRGEEMDALAFGSLAHFVVETFGTSPMKDERSALAIADFFDSTLDQKVAEQFGDPPQAAVIIQVEQLRTRLRRLAQWQADWVRQGFRIAHIEMKFEKEKAPFEVDGIPLYLQGRIDRIDQHESGAWVIFDYKTSEEGKRPEQTHRKKDAWIDLQLPLYRYLVATMNITKVQLGYIVLPKDLGKVGGLLADWSDNDLRAADETARNVVRGIRQNIFWPPVAPAPPFFEDFAAICQDHRPPHLEVTVPHSS